MSFNVRNRLKFGKISWKDLLCTKMSKSGYREFDRRGTLKFRQNMFILYSTKVPEVLTLNCLSNKVKNHEWLSANKLTLNMTKTELIIIIIIIIIIIFIYIVPFLIKNQQRLIIINK